jgi:hypothetical protein
MPLSAEQALGVPRMKRDTGQSGPRRKDCEALNKFGRIFTLTNQREWSLMIGLAILTYGCPEHRAPMTFPDAATYSLSGLNGVFCRFSPMCLTSPAGVSAAHVRTTVGRG